MGSGVIDYSDLLIDIEDQRHYGACSGNALSTHYEAIRVKLLGDRSEISAAYSWQVAKLAQGIPPSENKGVSLGSIFFGAKRYGVLPDKDYPYTDHNLTREPTAAEIKAAQKNRIAAYKLVYTFDEMLALLDKGFPVLCFVDMGGGHFINVIANDGARVKIVNSRGVGWMEQGCHWYSHAEFRKIFRSAGTITRFPIGTTLAVKFAQFQRGLK